MISWRKKERRDHLLWENETPVAPLQWLAILVKTLVDSSQAGKQPLININPSYYGRSLFLLLKTWWAPHQRKQTFININPSLRSEISLAETKSPQERAISGQFFYYWWLLCRIGLLIGNDKGRQGYNELAVWTGHLFWREIDQNGKVIVRGTITALFLSRLNANIVKDSLLHRQQPVLSSLQSNTNKNKLRPKNFCIRWQIIMVPT